MEIATESATAIIQAAIMLIEERPTAFQTELRTLFSILNKYKCLYELAESSEKATTSPSREVPRKELSTIMEISNWLVCVDTICLAELRDYLLPLDLLPSAVVDDINSRALDLLGEPALEEDGDEIIVFRDILAEVVARWDHHKE